VTLINYVNLFSQTSFFTFFRNSLIVGGVSTAASILIGAFAGYQTRFIPLHRYVIESLDFMYKHLRDGAAIPPSQVVRTTPRSSGNNLISKSQNVPDIPATPVAANLITFSNGTLNIPE